MSTRSINKEKYIRDGRSPIPKSENTSKAMSANKDRNTKPELILRKHLWKKGIRGYRLHKKDTPGRPDITFVKHKIAIFINGCFWHRCPHCNLSLPKSNKDFWEEKFRKNKERDKRKEEELKEKGWTVITIWECQIKNDIHKCVDDIKELLNDN